MSDLPAGALTYQAVVAEYFLGLRGAGLMISPLDQELVAEWERRGLPVAVVCRGLRTGLETLVEQRAPGATLPRSLRALRFAVEDEWNAYQRQRVGEAPAPPGEAGAAESRLAAARALLADAGRAAEGHRRDGYREAWRALSGDYGGTPLERVEAAVAQADARILAAWLGGLARPERGGLGPRLRLLCGPRRRGESPRAYREALRSRLLEAAREAGLTCLRGSV
ncbi:MAG: hypothetical protein IPO09_17375 [Anaeromyxobacter sp.]|nr:hypothetical protein [Anaeromyxobacter sp.]MBL0276529.1 hypothetical protein [Anaeromyxobacter sp.]